MIRTATRNYVMFISLIALLHSCMSAGTHGSIKAYIYPTNKLVLQHAVEEVIATNKQIHKLRKLRERIPLLSQSRVET